MPEIRPTDDALADAQRRVLELVRELWLELDPACAVAQARLDSSLQRDLGLDSLARAELLLRVERAFDTQLPAGALAEVDSVRDIAGLLSRAARTPRVSREAGQARAAPLPPAPADIPEHARTLDEVLRWHVARHGERVQVVLCSRGEEQALSYAQLQDGALRIAGWLRRQGLARGATVGIMLPTCAEYLYAYWGVLLGGGVPVPIYPPARLATLEDHLRRHAGILSNAQASLLLSTPQAMPAARVLRALVPGLETVAAVEQCLRGPPGEAVGDCAADDIAFIQYTSGSTGSPKGVVLSHANLLANIRAMGDAVGVLPDDVFVSWLPLYHDMGLIAAWLASVYYGRVLVLMSPLEFLARPMSWLWAMHRWRGTLTAAPNFAYELCLRHATDADLAGLDLGKVRVMASGAEAVSPRTVERFAARFARCGLRAQALTPVYGLAESTVGLLVSPVGRGARIDRIDREGFTRLRVARPAAPGDATALSFVSCGSALPGHQVRVVDEAGFELAQRVEGRLQFRGPSATRGYWRNPEATRALLQAQGWLDSGDLAYFADGEYVITGRVKDLIIRGGRHLHPDEIEQAVGDIPGVRKGRVAAFGVADPASGTEALVVVAETHASDAARRRSLRESVAARLQALLGEGADVVRLVPPGSLLKTSSGKLRRSATRELYLAGTLGAPARAPAWQVLRLGAAMLGAAAARFGRALGAAAWAARAWLVVGLLGPLLCLAVMPCRQPRQAWRRAHRIASWMLRAAGLRPQVQGEWPATPGQGYMVVVNHASYVDALVLLAALERPLCFVAKRELERGRLFAHCLRRLGVVFVERVAARQGLADVQRMVDLARAGASPCVFAEGTFRRAEGVLAFHLGAFSAAVRASVAVLPMALCGTRRLLPDGSWWPRHAALRLVIGEPLRAERPGAGEFAEASRLLRASREFVLREVGEPDAANVSTTPASQPDS